MRFIVDLYRYLIFAILAVMIVGAVYGLLKLSQLPTEIAPLMMLYGLGAISLFVGLIMMLGLTATFISIHDRHCELVEEIRDWRAGAHS
ncbi:hypothetical protein F9288_05735 [Sphingomonas sp. CL5.1]|uniref:hypothetical protein n=1 Tax=Sphingomonas sp. CL5.1 TaxID=2653203 RepID=UPI001583C546|nr:hypothetical protein [Sphingomonas sp. CL5.1]QKR99208.1 hypothetical protein F9288_05735 [Sphingomonas sp. CL5.1]